MDRTTLQPVIPEADALAEAIRDLPQTIPRRRSRLSTLALARDRCGQDDGWM
jgi:hypothetical protein